jgi:SP family sugar:H+ symporter-like MFS transporter
MDYVIHAYTGLPIPGPNASAAEIAAFVIPSSKKSLITSILSAGTFIGAVAAGDFADWIGRRLTILLGIVIFMVGVVLETASHSVGLVSCSSDKGRD